MVVTIDVKIHEVFEFSHPFCRTTNRQRQTSPLRRATNVSQLKRAIDSNPCIRPSFRGVFSRDTLPNRVERYPCVYVVNTDVSHRPGQHWVAIVLRNPPYGVFFDSFGRTPAEWVRNNDRQMNIQFRRFHIHLHRINFCIDPSIETHTLLNK
jgi:hypothetical protein